MTRGIIDDCVCLALLLNLERQLLQDATAACASELLPQVADVFLLFTDSEVLRGFSHLLLESLSV